MARYNPGPVDDQIVGQELIKVAQALDTPDQFLMLEPQYAAPNVKLRDGIVVFADGVVWNPGSGAGVYVYKSGSWVFLG
jgi:hypothetical protein